MKHIDALKSQQVIFFHLLRATPRRARANQFAGNEIKYYCRAPLSRILKRAENKPERQSETDANIKKREEKKMQTKRMTKVVEHRPISIINQFQFRFQYDRIKIRGEGQAVERDAQGSRERRRNINI